MLSRSEKHNRLVLGRIARNATRRSEAGIRTQPEHGALYLLHTKLADKWERFGDARRADIHRAYARDHLQAWLEPPFIVLVEG